MGWGPEINKWATAEWKGVQRVSRFTSSGVEYGSALVGLAMGDWMNAWESHIGGLGTAADGKRGVILLSRPPAASPQTAQDSGVNRAPEGGSGFELLCGFLEANTAEYADVEIRLDLDLDDNLAVAYKGSYASRLCVCGVEDGSPAG